MVFGKFKKVIKFYFVNYKNLFFKFFCNKIYIFFFECNNVRKVKIVWEKILVKIKIIEMWF